MAICETKTLNTKIKIERSNDLDCSHYITTNTYFCKICYVPPSLHLSTLELQQWHEKYSKNGKRHSLVTVVPDDEFS